MVCMVALLSLYRIIPNRPFGFAPQWAIALFAGAIIKDKKLAFIVPVISMLLSDLLYQGLYVAGLSTIRGFYEGQWINYLLFASVTVFGVLIKKITVVNVVLMSLIAPTYFFLISNFLTWAGVGDYVQYLKTWDGLMASYTAGIPFYKGSLMATLLFSGVLFGIWYLIGKKQEKTVTV